MSTPDVLHLYRNGRTYRWNRRRSGRLLTIAPHAFTSKAAMWRNARRTNPDFEICRIHDVTFTWVRGGTRLGRPALPARTPRPLPTIREARRRL